MSLLACRDYLQQVHFSFIDNTAAQFALANRFSSDDSINTIATIFWATAANWGAAPWFERVSSAANVVTSKNWDAPSYISTLIQCGKSFVGLSVNIPLQIPTWAPVLPLPSDGVVGHSGFVGFALPCPHDQLAAHVRGCGRRGVVTEHACHHHHWASSLSHSSTTLSALLLHLVSSILISDCWSQLHQDFVVELSVLFGCVPQVILHQSERRALCAMRVAPSCPHDHVAADLHVTITPRVFRSKLGMGSPRDGKILCKCRSSTRKMLRQRQELEQSRRSCTVAPEGGVMQTLTKVLG